MKRTLGLSVCAGVLFFAGCTSRDQDRAKEDMNKATAEAKKAGSELKQDARELSHNVDRAVQPDSRSASEKLDAGAAKLKAAGSEASTKLSQAALIAQVKSNLASEAGLSTVTGIDVDVSGGVVTLRGHVATQAQKDTADHAAAKVDGITRVQNEISVDH